MIPCLKLAVILCLLQVPSITADSDSSSFLIFNQDHNKCVKVESATSLTLSACNYDAKEQQFRWASESRLLSLSLKLCLAATEIKDWVKVVLFECDENNILQHWQCKNETLFGLKDQDLHLNWGNRNEKNLMIYRGSGVWSRWRMYGTSNDLCSKGFHETFTTGGNSFGTPCQFPFKFQEKWYAECTTDGRTDKQLWCATERDYDTQRKWGFCPSEGSFRWDTDPVTGVQYQRNLLAALTWHQARKTCQQQGSDLLSIVELHEQSYIAGLTSHWTIPLWIGINSLDFESGWQWSNGNPFSYLNWAPGHPSTEPGLSCGSLNPSKASKWESNLCDKKFGFICRRGNSTTLPYPQIKGPVFCPNHWVPYAGNCYFLERSKKMWGDALAACRKEEGDLASINSIEEQSFIISQTGYLPTDVLWIGLNDQRNQMLFEWSDHSPVTFTQWQSDEPSHTTNQQEDCVLIRKDGKWADYSCDKMFGYICKKKGSTKPSEGDHAELNPGCKLGYKRFGLYCYSTGDVTKTFEEANQACLAAGANLVDVADRYENAFLVSLVGLRPEKHFWIGFSNTIDRNTFKWTTKRKVTFTHFNVGMPDRKKGCVAMTTGVYAGLWDVISCNSKEKYICKKKAEGLPMTTIPPITVPLGCATGWTPIQNRNVCYKLYQRQGDRKKSWQDAEDFCKAVGGNLLSIHSRNDIRQDRYEFADGVWIGLRLQSPNEGFAWSDSSPIGYENWIFGEPNNQNSEEHCVEIRSRYGTYWNDVHCDMHKDWLCQIRKGATPKPEPTVVVEKFNMTDDGWLIYNDSHYYLNTEELPMEAARAYCKKHFGDLAVITGESERKFIWKQILKTSKSEFYIGLTVNLDQSFSWLDGTPVTYTSWAGNEPNFANNDENCVTIYKNLGNWNDINCGHELPSVCKRSNNFVNTTMAPTTVPKGGCAPEWFGFHGKCYKIFKEQNKQNWSSARSRCIQEGGNLVSVSNEEEQAFLTVLLLNENSDVWIGFNDVNWETHFVWTDGKGVSFTNWAKGHPARFTTHAAFLPRIYDCVLMVGSSAKLKGQWKVVECEDQHGFICKKNVDSQIAVPPTTSSKFFHSFGNDSYKLVAQKMKWDEARRQCQADDADLASVLNPVTMAYITLQIAKMNEPVWIGLNNNVTGGRFKWVDNWLLGYTKWGKNEPKSNYGCVYIDVDKTWKIAPCNNNYYSICKRSPDLAPTEPPQLPGHCPESKKQTAWIPFRGNCYHFHLTSSENWAHASVECLKMGASLASIEDPTESLFIQHNIDRLHDGAKSFWIGLYKSHEGNWMWLDNNMVDYTNWRKGMPSSQSCVDIESENGDWSATSCTTYKPYICKRPKIIKPTEKPQAIVNIAPEASHGSAGVTVAVVLIFIAIAGLGGFVIFRKRIPTPVMVESTFDNRLYFNNPNQAPVDTKGLVANIENNEQA